MDGSIVDVPLCVGSDDTVSICGPLNVFICELTTRVAANAAIRIASKMTPIVLR